MGIVSELLEHLERNSGWVTDFIQTGGRVEVYLWLAPVPAGDTLSGALIARMAQLGIELSLEIVPT